MAQTGNNQDLLYEVAADREKQVLATGLDQASYDQALTDLLVLHEQRKSNAANFKTYQLPQIPEKDQDEIYERIVEAEKALAAPDLVVQDYAIGSAEVEDELLVTNGNGLLLTAEHATQRIRTKKDNDKVVQDADFGTGGLSKIVQEDTKTSLIVPLGRQTGDANSDLNHPLKDTMRQILLDGRTDHYSIHGAGRGMVEALTDPRSFSVMLGVGNNPSDRTNAVADGIIEIAQKYDLRAGINQPFLHFDKDTPNRLKRLPDGSPKYRTFAAAGTGTSRYFAQSVTQDLGLDIATVQIELSDVLRLLPRDLNSYPGNESQRTGVYIGYLFVKDCVQLALSTL